MCRLRNVLALLLVLVAGPAGAQMTVTQSPSLVTGSLFAGTTTYTFTGLSAPSAGQGVVCVERNGNNRSVSSMTLSSSGTTTSFSVRAAITSPFRVEMWYATATGSETNANVVVTLSGTANDFEAVGCMVVSGWNSDQSGSTSITQTTSATTTHTVGTVTPTTANNILIHFAERGNATWTEDSNYTQITTGTALFVFDYWIQSSATARLHTMTSDINRDAGMLLAQFSGSGGGGGSSGGSSRMLTGVGR